MPTSRNAPNPRWRRRLLRAADAGASGEPADDRVSIEADDKDFEFDVNGNAVLSGNVVMRQGNRVIRADRLEYDAATGRAKLGGGVEFSSPELTVRGSSGDYSPALGAQFEGAQFELPSRNARGAARSMQVDADGTVTLEDVSFTTCPVSDEAWRLSSRSIVLDTRERNGTGRGTSVEFKGVPIVYLPWMTFPIGPQRKSGFFFPGLGGSSRNGAEIEVPYYWNIRPNVDLTTSPVYYAKRGVDFAGELRYLTARQRGTLDFNYLPGDDVEGVDRTHLHLEHVAELPGDWRFRIDATDVGDSSYFEDFAHGPGRHERAVHGAPRGSVVSRRTLERARAGAGLPDHRRRSRGDRPAVHAHAAHPRLRRLGVSAWAPIDYGFDGEFVNFERNLGVTGWRMDVAPRASASTGRRRASSCVRRRVSATRSTRSKDAAPGTDESPTRSLPFASLDAGLVFERQAGSRGQRRMTLEPRALYLYTPFREQSTLPLFDTGLPDLNLVQLFRANRYVGADRVNDANQVAFGLTSRLFNADSGAQYLSASVGQIYYFDKPRVVLPTEPVATRDTSDFIAQVSLTAYKNWNVEAGLQWNPEDTRSERSQLRLQYRPGPIAC